MIVWLHLLRAEVRLRGGRYSGVLEKVNKTDAAADALAERIGGKSRVKFSTDTTGREFDVVNDEYIAQAKPSLNAYGKSWRNQTKATGRKAYFQFEGTPSDTVKKIAEYADRYNNFRSRELGGL